MKTDIQLSTRFAQTQGQHQVGLLVSIGADQPPSRVPINVALVLDRSGSMAGEPLAAARDAACRFAGFLSPQDRLSLVAFDDQVLPIFSGVPGGDPAIVTQIQAIEPGGSTNLSGGWLKGHELCQAARVEGVNRVVLFTDGQANQGIIEPSKLAAMARGAVAKGIGTSCFGFGENFGLELLKGMSDGGRGNFWYIETLDQMGPVFDEEIEGLVSLAAQNVEVELRLTHPGVAGVTFLQDYTVGRTPQGHHLVILGDVYASQPRLLGVRFHVEHPEALGKAQLAEVVVRADAIKPEGVERVTTTLPVVANLDGTDHVEPVVDRTLLTFQAAQARSEAVRQADAGDYDGAVKSLRDVCMQMEPEAAYGRIAEEIADLEAAAERLEHRKFDESDRKYHAARSRAVHDQKQAYIDKISRKRRV